MSPRTKKAVPSDLSYEAALEELKRIVARLEEESISLEDSLQLFERGQLLAKHCATLLSRAELKVRRLAEGDDGVAARSEEG